MHSDMWQRDSETCYHLRVLLNLSDPLQVRVYDNTALRLHRAYTYFEQALIGLSRIYEKKQWCYKGYVTILL